MPVKRAIRMDSRHPSRTPKKTAPDRNYSPMTGTGHAKTFDNEQAIPAKDIEILHSLSSKLERSAAAFIRARKELEEVVTAEGSSELEQFFKCGSSDLLTELKRNRELTARAEKCLKENYSDQNASQGGIRKGSSYDFLKSILG